MSTHSATPALSAVTLCGPKSRAINPVASVTRAGADSLRLKKVRARPQRRLDPSDPKHAIPSIRAMVVSASRRGPRVPSRTRFHPIRLNFISQIEHQRFTHLLGVSSPLQVFTGTALRRATLRITRRQTPAAARAHGHGHSHGDGGHEHGQDYDDKDDINIHSHTWPPKAGETWKNFKPVEKKEPGDRLAEVLDVIRNAKYESISRNQGRDDLAMRLAAAEQENEKLTEEVKKLEVVNEKAAQELLKDA